MSNPPENPKIYHITHIRNLASIITKGCIESDGRRIEQDEETALKWLENEKLKI